MLNFHLVWNTSRYERLYVCLFVFMVLFCSSFGSRSERPRVLQLLIKMLIRCLMWEGLVLLYRNFLFKPFLSTDFYLRNDWTLRRHSSKRHLCSFRKPFRHVFSKTRPKWMHRKPFKCFDFLLFDSLRIRMCEFARIAASFIHECFCGVLMTHCPFSRARQ